MKKNYLKNSTKKKKTLSKYLLYSNDVTNTFMILNSHDKICNSILYKKNKFKCFNYDILGDSPYIFNIYLNSKGKDILNSNDSIIKEMFVRSLYHKYNNKIRELKRDKNLLKKFNYFRHV